MKSRRSFLAFVATAFISSISMVPAALAGAGGHNMLKFRKRHAVKQMEKRKKKEKIEEGQKSAE